MAPNIAVQLHRIGPCAGCAPRRPWLDFVSWGLGLGEVYGFGKWVSGWDSAFPSASDVA